LNRPINLLQERQLIPPEGVTPPKINLPNEFKKTNCSAEYVSRFLLSLCVLRCCFFTESSAARWMPSPTHNRFLTSPGCLLAF
jgi:hypothetical protein